MIIAHDREKAPRPAVKTPPEYYTYMCTSISILSSIAIHIYIYIYDI